MRVLVTGGAGFIGSNFVRRALTGAYPQLADAEVVVLDLLTYAGTLTNLTPVLDSPRLRFVEGDIRDAALVESLMAGTDAVVHFAAESHVDRSIAGAADFISTNVTGTHILLQAALDAGVAAVRARLHRRGLRLDPARLLARDPPAGAELALLGVQSLIGPARPRLPPHPRPAGVHHPLLEQLRAPPVPREGHPAVRHQPARRRHRPALRRRAQRPRLAPRRRPLPRHRARARRRAPRRGLQHRRRHRADQPRAHPPPPRRRRRRHRPGSNRSPTGSATTAATPSTGPRSPPSWATPRRCRSTPGSPTPSAGTPTTAPGGNPSKPGQSVR